MTPSRWPARLARRARGCPPGWKLTRAVSELHDPLRAHIDRCAWCASEFQQLRDVVDRVGALATTDGMSHESRQGISARLLRGEHPTARAMPHRFRVRPLWMGAMGVAALTVTWGTWTWVGRGEQQRTAGGLAGARAPIVGATSQGAAAPAPAAESPAPTPSAATTTPTTTRTPRSRASVRAVDAARFTRIAAPPDERILLREGVIVLDVVPLERGERFRVVTDDAEVEVRGTHFEVSASHGRLIAVRVASGKVQVKSTAGALATLEAGDEWVGGSAKTAADAIINSDGERPAPTSDSTPPRSLMPPRTAARIPEHARPRENARGDHDPRHSPAVNASFDRAWSLLRKGDTREAAAAFAEVEHAAGGGALAEDAAYWRAVAIGRSGDAAAARHLFTEFLRRFPSSARRGEASVALGWILLRAGLSDEARTAFERAAADPSAPVRDSAAEGIRRSARH